MYNEFDIKKFLPVVFLEIWFLHAFFISILLLSLYIDCYYEACYITIKIHIWQFFDFTKHKKIIYFYFYYCSFVKSKNGQMCILSNFRYTAAFLFSWFVYENMQWLILQQICLIDLYLNIYLKFKNKYFTNFNCIYCCGYFILNFYVLWWF